MQSDHFAIALTMRRSSMMRSSSVVELALQLRQDLGAAEDGLGRLAACSRRGLVKSPLSTASPNVAPVLSPHSARS